MPKQLKDGLWWSAKTKSFHYHVHMVSPVDGRRVQLKGDTCTARLSEAQGEKESRVDEWRRREVGLPVKPRMPTLAALHAEWRERNATALSPRTLAAVEQRMRLHLQALHDLPLDQINTNEVSKARAAYLAGAKLQSGKPRTLRGANKIVATLNQLLGWAVRMGILPVIPFQLGPLKQDPRLPVIVWPEQVAAFMALCAPRTLKSPRRNRTQQQELRRWDAHDAILLQIAAGLREGEAVGARWEWVDWRRDLYTVGEAKDRQAREIPLEDGLRARLRQRWEICGQPWEGLILTRADGRPHRAQFTRKLVARAARALQIPGHMTPHDLRRTFASALDELGFTRGQISDLMGHEDESTTEHYILRRPRAQAEAIQGLSRAFGLGGQVFPRCSPNIQPDQDKINNINTKIQLSRTS